MDSLPDLTGAPSWLTSRLNAAPTLEEPPKPSTQRAHTTTPKQASTTAVAIAESPAESDDAQQASLQWLSTQARRVFLDALAHTGSLTAAAEVARIDEATAWRWRQQDPAFAAECERAEALLSERMRGRAINAILQASDEQLLNHPNAYFFEQKRLDSRYKDNDRGPVYNDNRSIVVCSLEQLRAAVRALRHAADGNDELIEG